MANFDKEKHFLVVLMVVLRALGQAQGAPRVNEIDSLISFSNQLEYGQNPEELGSYFEGDIVAMQPKHDRKIRNGLRAWEYHWPGGVVPYEINGHFSATELSIIGYAFQQYHTRTCVRFRQRTIYDVDYIAITNDKPNCFSSVGRMGGRQEVNLESQCFYNYGTTIHELMHVVGFVHEQSRYDRDNYVMILKENIQDTMEHNFNLTSSDTAYGFGVNYDFGSVMHYSPNSFSKNGKPTIVPLVNTIESQLMGQRQGFSEGDVQKINAMYSCVWSFNQFVPQL